MSLTSNSGGTRFCFFLLLFLKYPEIFSGNFIPNSIFWEIFYSFIHSSPINLGSVYYKDKGKRLVTVFTSVDF